MTESGYLFGDGRRIADEIREAVKREVGVTVSVGVSWNKVFAKLASDMKKPDAVTEITRENYRRTVWRLPASDLLYVGKATERKLAALGIFTIGEIALAPKEALERELGKWGGVLHDYANGLDEDPVAAADARREIKSVGNSLTSYRDLTTEEDVKMLLLMLSESVAARVAEKGLGRASTVKVTAVDNELKHYAKQGKPAVPTRSAKGISECAFALFRALYPWRKPVRALGVTVCDFTGECEQLTFFAEDRRETRAERLDEAVMKLRGKYGSTALQRAAIMQDERFRNLDVRGEHLIRPANSEEDPPPR